MPLFLVPQQAHRHSIELTSGSEFVLGRGIDDISSVHISRKQATFFYTDQGPLITVINSGLNSMNIKQSNGRVHELASGQKMDLDFGDEVYLLPKQDEEDQHIYTVASAIGGSQPVKKQAELATKQPPALPEDKTMIFSKLEYDAGSPRKAPSSATTAQPSQNATRPNATGLGSGSPDPAAPRAGEALAEQASHSNAEPLTEVSHSNADSSTSETKKEASTSPRASGTAGQSSSSPCARPVKGSSCGTKQEPLSAALPAPANGTNAAATTAKPSALAKKEPSSAAISGVDSRKEPASEPKSAIHSKKEPAAACEQSSATSGADRADSEGSSSPSPTETTTTTKIERVVTTSTSKGRRRKGAPQILEDVLPIALVATPPKETPEKEEPSPEVNDDDDDDDDHMHEGRSKGSNRAKRKDPAVSHKRKEPVSSPSSSPATRSSKRQANAAATRASDPLFALDARTPDHALPSSGSKRVSKPTWKKQIEIAKNVTAPTPQKCSDKHALALRRQSSEQYFKSHDEYPTVCVCGRSGNCRRSRCECSGGFVQCSACLSWQHVCCMGLNTEEATIARVYYCHLCSK